jgi:hypothetical protein
MAKLTARTTDTCACHFTEAILTDVCSSCANAETAEKVEVAIEAARGELGNAGFTATLHMDDLALAALTEAVKHITIAAELLDGPK